MVFYKVEATVSAEKNDENTGSSQELRAELCERSETLYRKSQKRCFVFVSSMRLPRVIFGVIADRPDAAERAFAEYMAQLPFQPERYTFEESTFSVLKSQLTNAYRNDYIVDNDTVLERFDLAPLTSRYKGIRFEEELLPDNMTAAKARRISDELMFNETFTPELERIYTSPAHSKAPGHPVHYLLQADDSENRRPLYEALLGSLYTVGRLKNRRYSLVDYDEESDFPGSGLEALYKSSGNGTVILRYTGDGDADGHFANRGLALISAIGRIAARYRHSVLTVVWFPLACQRIKQELLATWESASFVELCENPAFGERALQYLKQKARTHGVRADKALLSLPEQERGYTVTDLNRLFGTWYDRKLRTGVYPQYAATVTAQTQVQQSEARGSAYDKLQSLIGLTEAKKVLTQALNYHKAKKLFADRGMLADRPAMHMVFTGNPGTAKTTVARLFAQIMKENGLLLNGDLYEVGRADLVGKYVGHTAPLVKQAFKKASGGVLFIDEAYSLVDDRDGMFGDEAINTLVQEMENHRHDTVVIFAGYPDKMEHFLSKNPGLRSRIAFHIPFEDYNADELCDIAALIAKEKGLSLTAEATNKLNHIFQGVQGSDDFGNGRFVRNVIERAKMVQANRLLSMDVDRLTDRDIVTLCAEDFEVPDTTRRSNVIKMGFSA